MLCEFSRRSFLKGSAAAAAALACPLCPADAAPSPSENGLFSPVTPLRPTQYGPVRGRAREDGTLCWYGIPYGAAPTGEDRWTSPREPARWRTVRDCTAPAPAAYQYTSFPLGTEDCLTLDIYSVPEAKSGRSRLSPWQRLFRLAAGAARQRTCAGHRAASSWPSVTGWGCSAGTACPPSLPVQTPPETLPCWTSSGRWTG